MAAPYIGVQHPRLLKRGGPWHRRCRTASFAPSQGRKLALCAAASLADGRPFNTFITVHWGALDLSEEESADATLRLFTRLRDWLRDNGIPGLWLWVRESDLEDARKGPHLHLLVHVTGGRDAGLHNLVYRWAREIAGCGPVGGALKTKRIGGRVDAWVGCSDGFRAALRRVVAYVLKGCPPCDAEAVNDALCAIWAGPDAAPVQTGLGGLVWGKRAGVSAALSDLMAERAKHNQNDQPSG